MQSCLSQILSRAIFTICVIAMLVSCKERDNYDAQPKPAQGYAPVYYDSLAIVNSIQSLPPQPLRKSGSIYLYKTYLLIVEPDSGVHVFDNKDTTIGPIPIGFIQIQGLQNLSIKNDVLYVQSHIGLLYIDVSKYPSIQVLGFLLDTSGRKDLDLLKWKLRPQGRSSRYDNSKVYIECPDESKGRIIDWRLISIEEVKCYYLYR